jgi:hypothetical protein
MGAGMAKAISYLILIVLGIRMTRSLMRWLMPWASFLRISLSASVMGASILLAKSLLSPSVANLVLLIALGIFIFVLLLFLTREIKESEMDFGKLLLGKIKGSVIRS